MIETTDIDLINGIDLLAGVWGWRSLLHALRTVYVRQHPLTPHQIFRVHGAIATLLDISCCHCPSAPGSFPIGDTNGPQSETP